MVSIRELEEYAKNYNIPIMMKDGINFLKKYIADNNIKTILEIGTAIGYSAIQMASVRDDIVVTTIERDESRYNIAIKNVVDFGLDDRINILLGDALDIELDGKYDLIFIDAANAQYIRFFQKFKKNLEDSGTIVSDNLNFHGLTYTNDFIASRNVRGIVKKIRLYIDFLKTNEEFDTLFLNIGDGIGITTRR